jgi:glycosyltransferase involved in cell wall biosynthesis
MRIGIEANGIFGWRGPSRNTCNLIRSLIEIDEQNEYYLFTAYEPNLKLPPKENFEWVWRRKRRFVPWLNVSLPLSVIKYNIDVFVFPSANFWIWKPTKTIVLTRAATVWAWDISLCDRVQAWVLRRRFNQIADKVGAVSHFNSTQISLSCGVDEGKFIIINNGIDPIFLDERIEAFADYGEYILFTGGTEPRKNISRLIEAYRILVSRGIKEKLVLVGGKYTPTEPELDEVLDKMEILGLNGRIIMHGVERDTNKLASIYRGSKLVVYPSLQEDFGMVSIEAMACGVPLVASNAPSIPEIAGDAAIYFDPYDVEEMAEKIEKVLKDDQLRASLILRGKERVKRFSWENSARNLLNLIEDVGKKK